MLQMRCDFYASKGCFKLIRRQQSESGTQAGRYKLPVQREKYGVGG